MIERKHVQQRYKRINKTKISRVFYVIAFVIIMCVAPLNNFFSLTLNKIELDFIIKK